LIGLRGYSGHGRRGSGILLRDLGDRGRVATLRGLLDLEQQLRRNFSVLRVRKRGQQAEQRSDQ